MSWCARSIEKAAHIHPHQTPFPSPSLTSVYLQGRLRRGAFPLRFLCGIALPWRARALVYVCYTRVPIYSAAAKAARCSLFGCVARYDVCVHARSKAASSSCTSTEQGIDVRSLPQEKRTHMHSPVCTCMGIARETLRDYGAPKVISLPVE